jgi:mono/diheme cytochrome c family protein
MRPKSFLAAGLLAGLTIAPWGVPVARKTAPVAPAAPAASASSTDEFRATVRPILSARCGQCHDPGGRMYARLPFDDPKTITSHSAGVLRRLKGDDRAAVEKWLAGLAPAAAAQ